MPTDAEPDLPGDVTSDRSRMPVPDGTIPVAVALLIAGVATFAFFRIGTVAVGGEEAFEPIVVAVVRARSRWRPDSSCRSSRNSVERSPIAGRSATARRPSSARSVRLSAVLVAVIVIVILAASPLIASSYFDGDWLMVVALIATFVAFAPAHLARGICSGSGRFRDYALIMGSDGVIRIVLTLLLAVVGIKTAGVYGFAIAVSPLFAVAYVWRRGALKPFPRYRVGERSDVPRRGRVVRRPTALEGLDEGSPAEWNEVTPNLGWLLLGSVFAAALLNAGPITATLLAADNEGELVTQFSFGVLLARIPLFLFQAVQAALLPGLSRLAARGEFVEFRSGSSGSPTSSSSSGSSAPPVPSSSARSRSRWCTRSTSADGRWRCSRWRAASTCSPSRWLRR